MGENFCELVKNKIFAEKTFAVPKDATPQNFAKKNFANSHKTVKFVKVFSLERFPAVRYVCCE